MGTEVIITKKARNWLLCLEQCTMAEEECSIYAWPVHVKYAIWSLDLVSARFRAYIEYDIPKYIPKFTGLENARVYNDSELDRHARRAEVEQHDGTVIVWEFGKWEPAKQSRTTNEVDNIAAERIAELL